MSASSSSIRRIAYPIEAATTHRLLATLESSFALKRGSGNTKTRQNPIRVGAGERGNIRALRAPDFGAVFGTLRWGTCSSRSPDTQPSSAEMPSGHLVGQRQRTSALFSPWCAPCFCPFYLHQTHATCCRRCADQASLPCGILPVAPAGRAVATRHAALQLWMPHTVWAGRTLEMDDARAGEVSGGR